MKLFSRSLAAGALVLFAAACSTDSPVGVGDELELLTMTAMEPTGGDAAVTLCKSWVGADPVPDQPFRFVLDADGGAFEPWVDPTNFFLNPSDDPSCDQVWSGPAGTTLTITEDVPDGYELAQVLLLPSGAEIATPAGNSVTFQAGSGESQSNLVFFKNKEGDAPPPPPGGDGCTPGFWRQAHHYPYWVGYEPSDLFGDVFENAFPGMTLGEVVWLGGGGLNALGRHTVAALLNASSPEVNYGMTPGEVIAAFNAVFPGGDYEGLKDYFEGLNEQGCSVEKNGGSGGPGGPPPGVGGPPPGVGGGPPPGVGGGPPPGVGGGRPVR